MRLPDDAALYLSHPEVTIDPAVPVPDWSLSATGRARLNRACASLWAAQADRFVASAERKAIETADALAAGRPVTRDARMNENDRSSTGFLPGPAFERMADAFFAAPHASVEGWERAVDAQARIVGAILETLAETKGRIVFCGHGGVGTLLHCYLTRGPIARDRDQPPGGGNVFAFTRGGSALTPWTALEGTHGWHWPESPT